MPASDMRHGALSHTILAGIGKDLMSLTCFRPEYAAKSITFVDFNIASAGMLFSGSCFLTKFI